jgi:hypothetical protein
VLVHSKGLHILQPRRVTDPGLGFDLDRVPAGVPVHPQMPGQRRHGGVVVAERVGRPPDGADRQRHPRRRQVVDLAERARRALRFSAAPDPHEPADQGDPAEAWHVVQDPDAAAVADRHHAATWAGRLQLTRLDRQHQTLLVADLHVEHVHAGNIKDRIGPGAPARTPATHRVRHRRGFRSGAWSPPILKAPTPSPPDQHAHPRTGPPMLRSEEPRIPIGATK